MNDLEFIERARSTTFYQNKLANISTDLWENIPFTTKQELRESDGFDLLGVDFKELATYHETSGTSGNPSPSWMSHRDTLQEAQVLLGSELNINENDLILNRFPFAVALPAFILYWSAREAKAGFISADQWNAAAPLLRVLEILQKTKPTLLALSSNEAIKLYHLAKEKGVSFPLPNLRAVIVGGELVSPARRKYIEQLFGVPVHMLFGSTETGALSFSCKEGHFHITRPNVKFEVVNEKNHPLGLNEKGFCVLTTGREGMPLLRYYNEDVIELKEAHVCSCGNNHPILVHYGRQSDSVMVNGKTFSFYDIQEAVYSLTEGAPFQWKLQQLNNREIKFILQYPFTVNTESIASELSTVFGTEVSVELGELFPLGSHTQKPVHNKTAYIEKIITEDFVGASY